MSAEWKPPGIGKALWVEWQAARRRDPVQRLAYLRRVTRKAPVIPRAAHRLSWFAKCALLFPVFLGLRMETITDASAGLEVPRKDPISGSDGLKTEPAAPAGVWLVEQGTDFESYSNGLRIENRFLSPNTARAYVVFRNGSAPEITGEWHSKPAGIVFHTSESVQAPFMADQNAALTRIGRELLSYVSRHKAYHFVIDRFGRVFRVVPETDVANHAGYSVWADAAGTYVNLNHSFLGISFEAQTRGIDEGSYLSAWQIHSGRLLVQMLAGKYGIPPANCVTHAQVSVNPDSMTVGNHTDGSGDFPFRELGLPDNYSLPVPSLYAFGFDYQPWFLMTAGSRLWQGLRQADERLRREANSQHLPPGQYKKVLQEKYRASITTLRNLGVLKEE